MRKKIGVMLLMGAIILSCSGATWKSEDFDGGKLSGITATTDGNGFLVSDTTHQVLWRTDTQGTQVAAGKIHTDALPYADGSLTEAVFEQPWGIVPLRNGYAVSDAQANVIRYVDATQVTTLAGCGQKGKQDGTALQAAFSYPTGMTCDAQGNLYVADTGNGQIRKISPEGEVSTLLQHLREPIGLAWSHQGLYIAESGANRILCFQDGMTKVVAGQPGEQDENGEYIGGYTDGAAEEARFDHPQGIAVDANGVLYVADTNNEAVRKIAAGWVITLKASRDTQSGPVQPRNLCVQGQRLLVTDSFAAPILEIDLQSSSYRDVRDGEWYSEKIRQGCERNLTLSSEDMRFSPNETVNRAEAVQMIANLYLNLEGNAVINGDAAFTDVKETDECFRVVNWAAEQGLISSPDGKFLPDEPMQREQFAMLLYALAEKSGKLTAYPASSSTEKLSSLADAADISPDARTAVNWCIEMDILHGFPDNTLQPTASLTRAQGVAMMVHWMNVLAPSYHPQL